MTILLKEKIPFFTLAILAYLLPFSTRIIWEQYAIVGTAVENDFTRVFIFGIDLIVLLSVAIFSATQPTEKVPGTFSLGYMTPSPTRSIVFLGLFILWVVASAVAADIQTWLAYAFIVRIILAALLFTQLLRFPAGATFSLAGIGFILGGVVQSFLGVTQFLLRKSIGLGFLGESPLIVGQPNVATFSAFGEKFLRAYGTLPHPNILAFFLTIAVLTSFCFFLIFEKKKTKILTLLATIVNSVGLILTFSRIFIVLAAFGFVCLYLIKRPAASRLKKIIRWSTGTAMILVVLAAITTLRPIDADQSLSLRAIYESVGASQTQERPISGVGPGQSVMLGNQYLQNVLNEQNMEYQTYMHQPVHNTYLLIIAETGWIGLLFFLMFIILVTDDVLKILRKNREVYKNTFFVFAAIAVTVTLIGMLVEHLFITNPNSLYLIFILFALLLRSKIDLFVKLPDHG